MMNHITKHIPNALTCCNLICGCVGIILVFKGSLVNGSYFIFAGAIFDFLDGLAARVFKSHSAIGKDLDSLADVITFGALPGFIAFLLIEITSTNEFLPYIALSIPVFSALRLAKFNNDPRQTTEFYGLPTPANALFFSSFPLILISDINGFGSLIQSPLFLSLSVVIFSFLLVSDIRLFSLKFKKFDFNENLFPVTFLIISNILFFTLFFSAIPFVIILYIILSLLKNFLKK